MALLQDPIDLVENDSLDRDIHKVALDLASYGMDPDSVLRGPGTLEGPRRYLQHDAALHVYFEYAASCRKQNQRVASYTVFMRVFRKVFRSHLQFRGGSQHAQCTACLGYKQELRQCHSVKRRQLILERYMEHLFMQWLDRQVWWGISALSTMWFERAAKLGLEAAYSSIAVNVLGVIEDSMDQAKFRIPRMRRSGRVAKALDALHRPALHVLGLWAMGGLLEFAVADEDLLRDSNTQLEALARALSSIHSKYTRLPLGLHLQQDNCVREGKNSFVALFMIALVLIGTFKWTCMCFLRKGHTHECIDQAHALRLASRSLLCRVYLPSSSLPCHCRKFQSYRRFRQNVGKVGERSGKGREKVGGGQEQVGEGPSTWARLPNSTWWVGPLRGA